MKQFWIGVALLVILLGLGVGSMLAMERIHTPIAEQLESASEAALSGHWQEAGILAAGAKNRWEHYWHLVACITDHTAMEDADAQFARLEVLARRRESVAFASACSGLASLFEAMADVQDFTLWNLL